MSSGLFCQAMPSILYPHNARVLSACHLASIFYQSAWLTPLLAGPATRKLYLTWCTGKFVGYVQMAGQVASQLWEEWQSGTVEADVFNVNVPLGFKTVEGTPVKPEILRTTVDMQSQYSSLYSEIPCHIVLLMHICFVAVALHWLLQTYPVLLYGMVLFDTLVQFILLSSLASSTYDMIIH